MGKSNFVLRKFDGDDCYSWAVFRRVDIPKGHRGPIFSGEGITPVVNGCSRAQANSYKSDFEKRA